MFDSNVVSFNFFHFECLFLKNHLFCSRIVLINKLINFIINMSYNPLDKLTFLDRVLISLTSNSFKQSSDSDPLFNELTEK
jgi:hypothetical protein